MFLHVYIIQHMLCIVYAVGFGTVVLPGDHDNIHAHLLCCNAGYWLTAATQLFQLFVCLFLIWGQGVVGQHQDFQSADTCAKSGTSSPGWLWDLLQQKFWAVFNKTAARVDLDVFRARE